MLAILDVKFEDFKKLSANHRVYYFIGDIDFDFYFVAESVIIKSNIVKSSIPNLQRFFSDRMFYNAIEVKFRLPSPKVSIHDIEEIKQLVVSPFDFDIDDIQDEEVKNTDIQVESVQD